MYLFFFFNDTATTEIYTLSLHDALPISDIGSGPGNFAQIFLENGNEVFAVEPNSEMRNAGLELLGHRRQYHSIERSEEHTSELQSPCNLVCRLLLEKKNTHPDRSLDDAS